MTRVITNYVRRFFDVYVVLCGGLLIDNAAWLRSSLLLIDIKRAKLYWNVVSESSPDRGLKCLFLQTDSGISLKKSNIRLQSLFTTHSRREKSYDEWYKKNQIGVERGKLFTDTVFYFSRVFPRKNYVDVVENLPIEFLNICVYKKWAEKLGTVSNRFNRWKVYSRRFSLNSARLWRKIQRHNRNHKQTIKTHLFTRINVP